MRTGDPLSLGVSGTRLSVLADRWVLTSETVAIKIVAPAAHPRIHGSIPMIM